MTNEKIKKTIGYRIITTNLLKNSHAETADDLAKRLFGKTRTESLDTHTCVSCNGPATEFRDEKSKIEWRITGLCQKCQDIVFK